MKDKATSKSNQFHLRIKNMDTLDKITRAKKLNNDATINDILNTCIDLGIDILLENSTENIATFGDQLEKNTNRILSKISRFQSKAMHELLKLQIYSSVHEVVLSYLMNLKDYEFKLQGTTLTDQLKNDLFELENTLVTKLKEGIYADLFEDKIDED